MGQFLMFGKKKLWEQEETMHSMATVSVPTTPAPAPALQGTEKLDVAPPGQHDPMTNFCQWVNLCIKHGTCGVSFEYARNEYLVRRLVKHDNNFFCVIFLDYSGMERKCFVLKQHNFNTFFSS